MKIIFFGTPQPAAEIMEGLIKAGHEITAVVTPPDRPQGRGQKVVFSPVKEMALLKGLPLEQPEKVRNNDFFAALLRSLSPDIAVVVAYGKIFPAELLSIPRYGFINVHAALLPKNRGAAPVQWALLKGEKETGVTIFKLVENLDAGPIIAQQPVEIVDEDNAETLAAKLFKLVPSLLLDALQKIEAGTASYLPQSEAQVTFAPALDKESGEVDWRKKAIEIHNRIRALVVWPGAHTYRREKRLKIIKSAVDILAFAGKEEQPGTVLQIIKDEGLAIACGKDVLLVSEVQPEGGRAMKAYDYAIGHDVKSGEILPN